MGQGKKIALICLFCVTVAAWHQITLEISCGRIFWLFFILFLPVFFPLVVLWLLRLRIHPGQVTSLSQGTHTYTINSQTYTKGCFRISDQPKHAKHWTMG